MATTPDARTSKSQHYVDFDEYVDFHLARTRSNIKYTEIFTALVVLGTLILAWLLAFVVFDQWVIEGGFGYRPRAAMLSLVLLVSGVLLVRKVVLPLVRKVNALYAARVIESSDPQLKSSLLNIVDLRNSGADISPNMLQAMEKRAAIDLSHVDVEHAVDHRPLLRMLYVMLAVVIAACLYTVLSPKDVFSSVKRALLPTSPIAVATQTNISDVTPGDDRLPARSFLTVEADVRGKAPDRVNLLYTTADRKFVDQTVEMRRIEDNLPRFRGIVNGENGRGLLQGLKYHLVAGDARTPEYSIEVIQPPSAKVDEVHYVFPEYMLLGERTQTGGDIDGWEGATVTLKATTNMPVKSAQVIFTDTDDPKLKGEELTMRVTDGTKLKADWKLAFRSDGTAPRFYRIQCTTEKGETDPDPAQYGIKIRPDLPPDVALLSPTSDLEMPANGVVPLTIQAADPDFKLRFITLHVEREGEVQLDQRLFEDQQIGQAYRGDYDFELAPLNLEVGKTIQFWIEAKDNKQPTANRKNTPRLNIKIVNPVTPQEAERQLADDKEKQRQDQVAQADDPLNQPNGPPPQDKPEPEGKAKEKERDPEKPDKNPDRPGKKEPQPANEPPNDQGAGGDGQSAEKKPGGAQNDAEALEKLIQREQQKQEQRGKPEGKSEEQSPSDSDSPKKDQSPSKGSGKSKPAGKQSDTGKNEPGKNDAGKNDTGKREKKPGAGDSKPGASEHAAKTDKPQANEKGKPSEKSGSEEKTGDGSPKQPREVAHNDPPGKTKSPAKPEDSPKTGEKGAADKKDTTKGGEKGPDDTKGPGDKPPPSKQDKSGSKEDKSGDGQPEKKQPGDSKNPKPDDKKSGNKTGAGKSGEKPAPETEPGKKGSGSKPEKGEQPKSGDSPDPTGGDEKQPAADKKPTPDSNPDKSPPKEKGDGGQGTPEKSGEKGENASGDKSKPDSSKGPDSGKGKPSDSGKPDMPPSAGEPGEGGDKKPVPPPESGNKNPASKGEAEKGGREKPAEDSPDAVDKPATGDEQGPATPSKEPNPNAAKAKKDLERKPGSEPGARKPSDSDPSDKKAGDKQPGKAADEPKPGEGDAKSTGDDPKNAKPAPSRKTDQPQQQNPDAHPKADEPKVKPEGPDAKTGEQPDAANEKLKGKGRPGGQKSEKPQGGGEGGSSKPDDEGQSGGNKPGAGDNVQKPGAGEKSDQPTGGKPGNEKGQGSKTKPSAEGSQAKEGPGEAPGKAASNEAPNKGEPGKGEPGKGEPGKGEPGKAGKPGPASSAADTKDGQPGAKGKSSGAGEGGSPQGSGNSREGGGIQEGEGKQQQGGGNPDAQGEPPPPDTDEAEKANLDYARKASNLVLKRLKEQLDRGEVDQALLDELGWTKQDMEKFAKRLEQQLSESKSDDDSPEANARRLEFEETLKSLRLRSEAKERAADNSRQRRTRQVDARRLPVPAEYREQYEAYTKSLSKQGNAPAEKREPAPAPAK